MLEKLSPVKPTNLRIYRCNLLINNQLFTLLEISPYYEKHNKEFLDSLVKRKVDLSSQEIVDKLITDELIQETFLPQLVQESRIRPEGKNFP